MNLLWLDATPVLHVVDTETIYKNAKMINDKYEKVTGELSSNYGAKSIWESQIMSVLTKMRPSLARNLETRPKPK